MTGRLVDMAFTLGGKQRVTLEINGDFRESRWQVSAWRLTGTWWMPTATYRNQQPQSQQMGFATQSQRQQWQGAADHPGNVQVSQSFSQGSDDDFSVLDDADDLPF